MDIRTVIAYLYWPIQLIIALVLYYCTARLLLIMLTLSPTYGQRVPYVPTRQKLVKKAFKMLSISNSDHVIDLGCGDGRFLVYGARKSQAEFTGVEINPVLYAVSKIKAGFAFKKGNIVLKRADYFDLSLKKYNKVFLFNMPSVLDQLTKKMEKELPQGALVVSIMFRIKSEKLRLKDRFHDSWTVYLYERVD